MKDYIKFAQKWQNVLIVLIFLTIHISCYCLYLSSNMLQIIWYNTVRGSYNWDYLHWVDQLLTTDWFIIVFALFMPIITFFIYYKATNSRCNLSYSDNEVLFYLPIVFAVVFNIIVAVMNDDYKQEALLFVNGIIGPIIVLLLYLWVYYLDLKKEMTNVIVSHCPFGCAYVLDKERLRKSFEYDLEWKCGFAKYNFFENWRNHRFNLHYIEQLLNQCENPLLEFNVDRNNVSLKDLKEEFYRKNSILGCISAIIYEEKKPFILSEWHREILHKGRMVALFTYIIEHNEELSIFFETHKDFLGRIQPFANISEFQAELDFVRTKKQRDENEKKRKEAKAKVEKKEWIYYFENNEAEILNEIGKYEETKGMSIDSLKLLSSKDRYMSIISHAKHNEKIKQEKEQRRKEEEQKRIEEEAFRQWLLSNLMSVVSSFNNVAYKPSKLYLTSDDYKYTRAEIEGLSKADYERCKKIVDDNVREYDKFCSRFTERISDVPFVYLWNYIPTSIRMVDMEDAKSSRLILSFKDGNNIDKVSDEVATKLKELFRDIVIMIKDGKKHAIQLNDYYLVCVPPATQVRYEKRFQAFSSEVSKKCGINSDFKRMVVESGVIPGHLGGDIRPRLNIDTKWFKGKKIVLFDDIVTRGETMRYYIDALRGVGAEIVCCMSLGKTKH